MVRPRSFTTLQQDAEALVVGLNMLLTSKTRVSVFAIARTETIEKIEGSELRTEMLQAIDLLEKQFTRKQ